MIDWKPGDNAMCVKNTDSFDRNIGLQLMNVYTVSQVFHEEMKHCTCCGQTHTIVALTLQEVKPTGGYKGWDHKFFVKVDPVELDDSEERKENRPKSKNPELEEV